VIRLKLHRFNLFYNWNVAVLRLQWRRHYLIRPEEAQNILSSSICRLVLCGSVHWTGGDIQLLCGLRTCNIGSVCSGRTAIGVVSPPSWRYFIIIIFYPGTSFPMMKRNCARPTHRKKLDSWNHSLTNHCGCNGPYSSSSFTKLSCYYYYHGRNSSLSCTHASVVRVSAP